MFFLQFRGARGREVVEGHPVLRGRGPQAEVGRKGSSPSAEAGVEGQEELEASSQSHSRTKVIINRLKNNCNIFSN